MMVAYLYSEYASVKLQQTGYCSHDTYTYRVIPVPNSRLAAISVPGSNHFSLSYHSSLLFLSAASGDVAHSTHGGKLR